MAATFSATAAAPIWARGVSLAAALIRFAEGWLAPLLFLAIRPKEPGRLSLDHLLARRLAHLEQLKLN
jgi:hypothetical protein